MERVSQGKRNQMNLAYCRSLHQAESLAKRVILYAAATAYLQRDIEGTSMDRPRL